MNTTIKNERAEITVSNIGAELMSIIYDGKEYLWQGDASVWEDRSPILFPSCGRLKDARYTYGGKTYEMGIHGFLWKSEMTLEEAGENFIRYTLKDNEKTREIYPFSFEANITYKLDGNKITLTFGLKNTDSKELIFSHGYHPGFILPMCEDDDFSDCYVEFCEECKPKLVEMSNTTYLVTGNYPEFPLVNNKILPLTHELFDTRSVFLKDMACSLTLRGKNTKRSVTVSFPECEILGFWQAANSDAEYLCVEPWNGTPSFDGIDEVLEEKAYTKRLAPGERYENSIYISLT